MGDIFRGSFDVPGVDIVFEVCVFDAYRPTPVVPLETMSRGSKIMTHTKKKKNSVGLLTEICIKYGLPVSSRF